MVNNFDIGTAMSYSDFLLYVFYVFAKVSESLTLDQVCLATFGITAIWLTNDSRESFQKWGPVIGLLGQPFWLYATYNKELWGMLIICCFYTVAWIKGVIKWHFKPKEVLFNISKETNDEK